MNDKIEIERNQGEIILKFKETNSGKITLRELGLTNEDLYYASGLVRIVFDLQATNTNRKFFSVPTIEFAYKENMSETHWICDYNNETILDKLDHHGKSTVMLLSRKKMEALDHHHENTLIVHAEFPEPVHIDAADSYIQLFN